jgi:hypothetical protein
MLLGMDPQQAIRRLVADALVAPDWPPLLERAGSTATTTRDRQVVAVAAAYLHGDADRALLLARDHLAEHPGSVLVAHIAALATQNLAIQQDDQLEETP